MFHSLRVRLVSLLSLAMLAGVVGVVRGEEPAEDHVIALANGQFELIAPKDWKREKPKSRIIEHEFSAPAAEGDEQSGRLTIMAAGGSVEANIERWYAQFSQPDGKATADVATQEEKEVAGVKVHVVDISGTFMDRPNPMSAGVERENYRMLGVIFVGDKLGQYFLKFYGPAKTVEQQKAALDEMVAGLTAK